LVSELLAEEADGKWYTTSIGVTSDDEEEEANDPKDSKPIEPAPLPPPRSPLPLRRRPRLRDDISSSGDPPAVGEEAEAEAAAAAAETAEAEAEAEAILRSETRERFGAKARWAGILAELK